MNETPVRKHSGNVIWKNLISIYPGAVLYGLLFNVSLMIDSIIAGQSLGAGGIAAVALGVPGYGVLAAIIYSLIHGSGLRMIWTKGCADDEGFRRAFNGGATLVCLVGLVFAILIFVFSESIVLICGGDMVDAVTFHNAVIYLCFCAPIVFLTALGMILQEVLNVLGFQTNRAALGAINVAVNLIVSISCVYSFPAAADLFAENIVMRLKRDSKRDMMWIVTSSAIAYMTPDYQVTTVQKFPYSNNFDLFENSKGDMWVLASNGIYVTPAEELIANGEINPVYYSIANGLPCITTANSYSDMTSTISS